MPSDFYYTIHNRVQLKYISKKPSQEVHYKKKKQSLVHGSRVKMKEPYVRRPGVNANVTSPESASAQEVYGKRHSPEASEAAQEEMNGGQRDDPDPRGQRHQQEDDGIVADAGLSRKTGSKAVASALASDTLNPGASDWSFSVYLTAFELDNYALSVGSVVSRWML